MQVNVHTTDTIRRKPPERSNARFADKFSGLSDAICAIIGPRFEHPAIPLGRSAIKGIRITEIIKLHSFLVSGILQRREHSMYTRPECPMQSQKDISMARYDYKKSMTDYIASYGYRLDANPCDYKPAFLEALANYCEHSYKKQ